MPDVSNPSPLPLFTIGYGSREIVDFLRVLQEHDIAFLIDVRSRPYSRYKPDFSKEALEAHLRSAGIRYVFMGDTLGGQPDDPTCYDENGKVSYERIRQTAFFAQGIERIRAAWEQQLRVILMCSEGKPEACHRSMLIGDALQDIGIEPAHIDETDQIIDQQTVMARARGGQLSLFDDEPARQTSRKRYRKAE
jgi:uncharacterized protein (DUF488 family)